MAELVYSVNDFFEKYFKEPEPEKRLQYLEDASDAVKADERYAKLKSIADRRYSTNKDGQIIDRYIAAWVNSQIEVEHMGLPFFKKKRIKHVLAFLEPLNLPSDGSEIDPLEYMELCNLVRLYIHLCETDNNYNSVVAGLGDRGEKSLENHILSDLSKMEVMVPDMVDLKEMMEPLSRAVREIRMEKFHK